MSKGTLFVLTGPSGVGKGTVRKEMEKEQLNLFTSISATTRQPREGEQEGVHYYFLTREQFEQKIQEDAFLEYAQFADNYYGTLREPVQQHLDAGENVLLEIEVQGALQVKERCPEAVMTFILPPSMEELRSRLTGRGTETPEKVEKRLKQAEWEMTQRASFQHQIVNDDVVRAKDELASIIRSEGC
ncbi:MAG: guanylate kinase [Butyricicoccaceae bacterium]